MGASWRLAVARDLPREIEQPEAVDVLLVLGRRRHAVVDVVSILAQARQRIERTYRWIVLRTYPPVSSPSASQVLTVSVPSWGRTHFHSPVVWFRICRAATGWRKSSVNEPRSVCPRPHNPSRAFSSGVNLPYFMYRR